jgi:hypothetical protein
VGKKKQQGNGSGSVYPRKNKDGKITSYLGSYFTADGKRRTVSAKTKTECREKLRRAMSEADRGLVFDAAKQTVEEYVLRWIEDFCQSGPRAAHVLQLQATDPGAHHPRLRCDEAF